MEETLRALGGILLKALPTFILILILNFYLKFIFFRPLEKVLARRNEATEGSRKIAEESLRVASEKAAAYENALREARAEVYREQEDLRRQLHQEREAALKRAREDAESIVKDAKAQIERDVAESKRTLAGEVEALANAITERMLRRAA